MRREKNKIFSFTCERFRKKLISEKVVKTIRPKKTTIVNGGIYYIIRSVDTKIINLNDLTYKDIIESF